MLLSRSRGGQVSRIPSWNSLGVKRRKHGRRHSMPDWSHCELADTRAQKLSAQKISFSCSSSSTITLSLSFPWVPFLSCALESECARAWGLRDEREFAKTEKWSTPFDVWPCKNFRDVRMHGDGVRGEVCLFSPRRDWNLSARVCVDVTYFETPTTTLQSRNDAAVFFFYYSFFCFAATAAAGRCNSKTLYAHARRNKRTIGRSDGLSSAEAKSSIKSLFSGKKRPRWETIFTLVLFCSIGLAFSRRLLS